MSIIQSQRVRQCQSTALYPHLHAENDPGLPVLVVENPLATAVISLQGAQVLSFKPSDQREMLWISPKAKMQAGNPIRAGIPLCLPWFGPRPEGGPLHGFARTLQWHFMGETTRDDGATRIDLELFDSEYTRQLWPYAFRFLLQITVGSALKMLLTVENRSESSFDLAFAYHNYFDIPALDQARVTGLHGVTYVEKEDRATRHIQDGDVTTQGYINRYFYHAPERQIVKNAWGDVMIDSGTSTAVVWNAGHNAATTEDIGAGNHVGYICVERGDVEACATVVPAGGVYRAQMKLSY